MSQQSEICNCSKFFSIDRIEFQKNQKLGQEAEQEQELDSTATEMKLPEPKKPEIKKANCLIKFLSWKNAFVLFFFFFLIFVVFILTKKNNHYYPPPKGRNLINTLFKDLVIINSTRI